MTHKNEQEVEIIGGETALTKEEEDAISAFIKSNKVRKHRLEELIRKRPARIKKIKLD